MSAIDQQTARTLAAGKIIDIMSGGRLNWRNRLEESDFLESADWLTALAYADAAIEVSQSHSLPGDVGMLDTTDVEGRLEGYTPPESQQDWDCVAALQTIRNLRIMLAGASRGVEMRAALEAWSESIIMRANDRDISERDIGAGYGGDVMQAASLTRAALTPSALSGDAP